MGKTTEDTNFTQHDTSIIVIDRGQLILGEATGTVRKLHWPFSQMNGLKIRSLYQLTKGKAIKLSGKSLHGFYELPWFIFLREGSEQESFPWLLRSSWRITQWSIRARKMIHYNNTRDLTGHLNIKHASLISFYQVYDVVLLNQLDFAKSIVLWMFFSCKLRGYRDTEHS